MKRSIKGATSVAHLGMTESLGTLWRRALTIFQQNTIPYEMVKYGLPYEASRTYRAMKIEFERNRYEAAVEANWARARI